MISKSSNPEKKRKFSSDSEGTRSNLSCKSCGHVFAAFLKQMDEHNAEQMAKHDAKETVLDKEFEGNFMKPGYRMPNQVISPGGEVNPDDTHPITALGVKSVIAQPSEDSFLSSRQVHVRGAAWAGEAGVTRVDISIDAGRSWQPARLGIEQARYAWRLWEYAWRAPGAGDFTIMSRATDDQGRTQPQTAAWNPSGYLYNAIDRVTIHVHA
jgi:sulfite oxidase